MEPTTTFLRVSGERPVAHGPAYQPLDPVHPLTGAPCPACGELFHPGDVTTLVPLGPGAASGSRSSAREGRAYNAVAIAVHWDCATGGAPVEHRQ